MMIRRMNVDFEDRWSSLPSELLQLIGNTLDSPVDLLRLRSVCTAWRSFVPLPSFEEPTPRPHLKLPPPCASKVVLIHSTICCLTILNPPSLSDSKGWLTKVSTSKTGKLRLLQPISNYQAKYSPIKLSLEDISFVNIAKTSVLVDSSSGSHVVGINKVVCFSGNNDSKDSEFSILAIIHEGKLCYWKKGDEKWTVLDDKNFEYDDIIEYKGQFYVVDRCGTVSWIDSSLNVIQYSPSLYGCGGQKYLVESCGDLYVVDTYLDGERRKWPEEFEFIMHHNYAGDPRRGRNHRMLRYMRSNSPKAVDFRVFRLDEEWGNWNDVKSLGDRAFVLASDCCFSVAGQDFVGGKGNCIYFTDGDNYNRGGLSCDSIRVYQLESRSIEKLALVPQYSKIFWPPNFFADLNSHGCSNVIA